MRRRQGPRVSAETKARLALWLLMIRSRLQMLGGRVVWSRYQSPVGYAIQRPHSPIDRVLRVWMEGVVRAGTDSHDEPTFLLLGMLIDLLLHEARDECDYRNLFPFIASRINVHVMRLLQETDPFLIGEMVFADTVALYNGTTAWR